MLKKHMSLLAMVAVLVISLLLAPVHSASAQIADGTYQIGYEIKASGSGNTSIADGYFIKPATLTVSGGTQTIQLTVKDAHYVKSLSVQGSPVTVVSDDGQNRVVKFNVSGDLSKRIPMSMHIKVPDLYDTTHGADAVFFVDQLSTSDAGAAKSEGKASGNEQADGGSKSGEGDAAENPRTADESPIVLYTVLLVLAGGALVLVRKLGPAKH